MDMMVPISLWVHHCFASLCGAYVIMHTESKALTFKLCVLGRNCSCLCNCRAFCPYLCLTLSQDLSFKLSPRVFSDITRWFRALVRRQLWKGPNFKLNLVYGFSRPGQSCLGILQKACNFGFVVLTSCLKYFDLHKHTDRDGPVSGGLAGRAAAWFTRGFYLSWRCIKAQASWRVPCDHRECMYVLPKQCLRHGMFVSANVILDGHAGLASP